MSRSSLGYYLMVIIWMIYFRGIELCGEYKPVKIVLQCVAVLLLAPSLTIVVDKSSNGENHLGKFLGFLNSTCTVSILQY